MIVGQFIDSLDAGGAETMVIDLSLALKRFGIESRVLHFGNEWLAQQCRKAAIQEAVLPHYRAFKKIHSVPRFSWHLSRYLRREGIGVLHSHLYGAVVAGHLAAKMAGIRSIGTLHDTYTLEERVSRVWPLRLAVLSGLKLVAVSNQMRERLNHFGDFEPYDVSVVVNGTNTSRFIPVDRIAARQRLNLPCNEVIFVCVARMVPLKRHDVLVEAFAKLTQVDNSRLLLIGDGPCADDIRRMVAERGLEKKVTFLGFRDDVNDWIAASDCFVLCSDSEGMSCSILEAMASGLPIIATSVGGNAEVVAGGENGLLVERANAGKLAQAMQVIALDQTLRVRFGAHSRKIATSRFSFEKTAHVYAELYRNIGMTLMWVGGMV